MVTRTDDRFDERSRRRPRWRPGQWVWLGVHGPWAIPEPKPVTRPLITAGRGVLAFPDFEINGRAAPELARFFGRIADAHGTRGTAPAVMAAVHHVLSFNYDLSEDDYLRLIMGGFLGLPGGETLACFAASRVAEIVYGRPIVAMARIVASLPRINARRTSTLVRQN